ncbi:YfhE family protein [Salinibacillus xinjiangensis]|uniref:YfhE family protein n=1 Tax=Salinibacillus xinjiangensis TaxID=1229268 RepID=A0A6G1X942_9BACI|nr:YfhE family protein [Salinibacillus xinjiangensis]MRG87523.1 YfhE family protein [Salinibacillus xinjiangensis]
MGKEPRRSHDEKRFNLSKTQQVLYQQEFKRADKAYNQNRNR